MTTLNQNLNLQWLDAFKNSADIHIFGTENWISGSNLRDVIIPKSQQNTIGVLVEFEAELDETAGVIASVVSTSPLDMAIDDITIKDINDKTIENISNPSVLRQLINYFMDEALIEDTLIDIPANATITINSSMLIPVSHENEVHKIVIDCGTKELIYNDEDVSVLSATFKFSNITSEIGVDSFEVVSQVINVNVGENFINSLPNKVVMAALMMNGLVDDVSVDDVRLFDNQHRKFAINDKFQSLSRVEDYRADYTRATGSLIMQFNEFFYDDNNGSTFRIDGVTARTPTLTTINRIGGKRENVGGTRPEFQQPDAPISGAQPGEAQSPPVPIVSTPPSTTQVSTRETQGGGGRRVSGGLLQRISKRITG